MSFDPSGPSLGDGIFGLPFDREAARVVLVPVPWEPTTSYRKGTAGGPENILRASKQVDLFDRKNGRPYEAGIVMLDPDPRIVEMNREACVLAQPIIDRGGVFDDASLARDLARVNALSRELDDRVGAITGELLDAGKLVGVIGGDHSCPFGFIRELAARIPGMGILHVDAHADLRKAYEGFESSHASIFHNVHERLDAVARIVQVGLRDYSEEEHAMIEASPRLKAFFDDDLAARAFDGEPFSATARAIVDELPENVYLSVDIDGLEPALCPGTGTPVPGGLSFRELCGLVEALVGTGRRIVGFDLNEVAGGSEWDGIVGARVLYKTIGFALRSGR